MDAYEYYKVAFYNDIGEISEKVIRHKYKSKATKSFNWLDSFNLHVALNQELGYDAKLVSFIPMKEVR